MTDRSATATPVLPSPRGTVLPGEGADWTPPSWDDVVREHADRVYRLAYRLTGNPHDAEDLTQETFIRVFRSLADYKPGTFEGWLHRITTNLFLDMVRRRARLRMEGLPEDSDRLPGGGPEPEQVFSDTHLDPVLQAALDELAPEFRAAVVLCDVEGLSYEEIGATLGVKLGTVRSRIHRGRAALRAALERRGASARGGHDEGRSGGRGMTGARRFSLSSPDWGQAHLTLDAIVAYVDDELSRRSPTRGREAHLECCGECRAEVVAQRQARAALRGAGGPYLPSSLLHSLRSIPVEAELPPMPPGLGVTADGQFVLLRDASPGPAAAPCDHRRPGSGAASSRCAPGRPRIRPGRGAAAVLPPGAVRRGVGLALGALAVGALATPSRHAGARAAEPASLGGAVLDLPARRSPRRRATCPPARLSTAADAPRPRTQPCPGGPRRPAARPPEPHPGRLPSRAVARSAPPRELGSATRTSPLLRQAEW